MSRPSEWVNPLWLLYETMRGLEAGFAGGMLVVGALALLGGLLVGLSGWIGILRREWYVAVVMVLPGVLLVGLMMALGHNLWPRFLFFCAGFAILIAVHGTFAASRLVLARFMGPRAPVAAGYALCGLMIVASLASLPRYYRLPKQDFAGARDWVEAQREGQEVIVTAGLAGRCTAATTPRSGSWSSRRPSSRPSGRSTSASGSCTQFRSHLTSYHPDLRTVVDRDFETVRVFPGSLRGGGVYVCRERAPGDARKVEPPRSGARSPRRTR